VRRRCAALYTHNRLGRHKPLALVFLAGLIRAKILAVGTGGGNPSLRTLVSNTWRNACDLDEVVALLCAASEDARGRLESKGDEWKMQARACMKALAKEGITNGALVCMRGACSRGSKPAD